MDASEFRNYILGLIFYRFLSKKPNKNMQMPCQVKTSLYQEAWQMKNIVKT
ncbi:hypothetical protein ACVXZ0_16470 [Staphylococcus aureus]